MTGTALPTLGRELFLGNVNTWECDEMGHMNVHFYAVKAQQALAVLGHYAGLGPDVLRAGNIKLDVRDDHLRFLREMHAGAAVSGHGGIVDAGQDWFRAYIELRHNVTGDVAATFNTLVGLKDNETGAAQPLPQTFHAQWQSLRVEVPDYGQPRSLHLDPPAGTASMAAADRYGLYPIYRGQVLDNQCDRHGRMLPAHFIGRVSDGIVNLLIHLSKDGQGRRVPGKVGGAVVEYRLHYHAFPREGDILVTRSGLKAVAQRTMHFAHWVLDAVTGEALCTSEAIAVNLDLEARRAVALTDEDLAFLNEKANPDLSL